MVKYKFSICFVAVNILSLEYQTYACGKISPALDLEEKIRINN